MPAYRVRNADGTPAKHPMADTQMPSLDALRAKYGKKEDPVVERTRLEQIDRLRAAGWYTDDETARFQNADADAMVVGGPTYLKNPDGQVCACSGGTEQPVDGLFNVQSAFRKGAVYANGRCIALQG